jgi:hypothetical protein
MPAMRNRLVAIAGAALLLALVPASQAATPKVTGTVGPGYTISLTKGGKKATTLKSGKVTFTGRSGEASPRPSGVSRNDHFGSNVAGHPTL